MRVGRNYKVLKKYIISFALVFLLPSMCMMLFFNTYTTRLIGKQSQDRLINRVASYYDSVESRLQNLKNIFVELSVDKETYMLESLTNVDLDDVTRLKAYSKKLYTFSFINNMIKGITVYYTNTDTVMNNKGKFSYYYAYDQFFKMYGIPQDDFRKMLRNNNALKIFRANGLIYAVQSIPISENYPQGCIVIGIDENVLMGFTPESNSSMIGNYIIADKQGGTIAHHCEDAISRETIRSCINSSEKIQRNVTDGGKEYTVVCSKASVEGLYYLSFVPAKELEGGINEFNMVMLKVILVFFVLGLAIVWAFSAFNYTPVKTMLREITPGNKKDLAVAKADGGKATEYDIIKMYIDDLCREKDDLSSRVSIHMNDTRNNFLKELVTDGCTGERVEEMVGLLNLNLPEEYFCFIYIVMDSQGQLDANEVNKAFQVQERMDGVIKKFSSGYRLQLDNNRKGILINVGADTTPEQIEEAFVQLCRELNENSLSSLKAGIGGICKGYDRLPQGYKEAFEAARYGYFYSLEVCRYGEAVTHAKESYYYPSGVENKLMNCCEIGDSEGVDEMITDILSRNFIESRISLKSAYALYYDLKGTLNRVMKKCNMDLQPLSDGSEQAEIDLNGFVGLDLISAYIRSSYRAVCDFVKRPKANMSETLVRDVINYINDNYCDRYLSCVSVADKFNISQPYLSVILKKHTGMSYGDYVNSLRIKEAKKLLKESGLSVNEIAEKLGYGSGNGFMRTFKNIEGVTPRQYSSSINDQ